MLGISDWLDYLPDNLSGGQKQRVAIGRLLVGNPDIVIADERTVALDKESALYVGSLLKDLGRERRLTTLMVMYDSKIIDLADRILAMEDGRIFKSSNPL